MDVTSAEDWKGVIDTAFSRFGRLDVLVNNAGTTYRNKVRYLAQNDTEKAEIWYSRRRKSPRKNGSVSSMSTSEESS